MHDFKNYAIIKFNLTNFRWEFSVPFYDKVLSSIFLFEVGETIEEDDGIEILFLLLDLL